MKKLEAVIRPEKLASVREGLRALGVSGMTVLNALGHGQEPGYSEIYRHQEYPINFHAKVKVELIVNEDLVEGCIKVISELARTGAIGDGKIIVSNVDFITNIRTGETSS